MAFIMVFRPHQRPALAYVYEDDADFVDTFRNNHFATSCHAECDGATRDHMEGATPEQQYLVALEAVAHDLSALTRLDNADEVELYCTLIDYGGHHNKGIPAVAKCARSLNWMSGSDESL